MLTKILLSEASPRPATSHVLNQSTVGVGLPAGDSGTAGRGRAGNSAPTESGVTR